MGHIWSPPFTCLHTTLAPSRALGTLSASSLGHLQGRTSSQDGSSQALEVMEVLSPQTLDQRDSCYSPGWGLSVGGRHQ